MVSKLDWDLLPDEFPYEDRGCDMAPSCLSCPFPKCLEEEPWGRQKFSKRRRAERMAELRTEGKSIVEIAGIFGVSPRTVGRALKAVSSGIADAARQSGGQASLRGVPTCREDEAIRLP